MAVYGFGPLPPVGLARRGGFVDDEAIMRPGEGFVDDEAIMRPGEGFVDDEGIATPGGGWLVVAIGCTGCRTTVGVGRGFGAGKYHTGIPNVRPGRLSVAITGELTTPANGNKNGIV
jgi:hypothetical protein